MPSAFGHLAPALALVPAFHVRGAPSRLWVLGALCAAAPDLDVVAFCFGVPYEHPLGHRGLWHSIPFAAAAALLVTWVAFPRAPGSISRPRAWLYLFLAMASQGVLAAFTDGGLGVALLAPFERGAAIFANELLWVWLPSMLLAAGLSILRARRSPV